MSGLDRSVACQIAIAFMLVAWPAFGDELEPIPDLPEEIRNHPAFQAPPSRVKEHGNFNWKLRTIKANNVETTEYLDRVDVFDASNVLRKSVNDVISQRYLLGGLFLQYLQIRPHEADGKRYGYLKRKSVVSNITGKIFPIDVGNAMSFDQDYYQDKDGRLSNVKLHVEYKVIEKYDIRNAPSLPLGVKNVRGDVFEVERATTNSDTGGVHRIRYLYSSEINFVFAEKAVGMAWDSDQYTFMSLTDEGKIIVAEFRAKEAADISARIAADLAAKRTQSAALAPRDRAAAKSVFSSAFELFQAGEFGAAERQFLKGLASDPANPLGNFYLAETYARMNKPAEAKQYYRYTVEFGPGSKEAVMAEDRLASGK